ncbi:MAG: alpha/beta hydrolase [Patescibacteria group bacterium]|nr:alpha/beta hydrolase [Patescibacteria group bacterium]
MPKLILLPGVGADARLFEPQREVFPDLVVPDWLPPEPEESLPHYGARMAEAMAPLFRNDGPAVLGGVSFGGMVAYEAARHVRPTVVVQIASCRSRHAVRALLRATRPVAPVALPGLLRTAKMLSPLALELLTHLKTKQRDFFVAMFKEADSAFMKWALTAILAWEPCPPLDVPVRQIHGRRDLLLPVENVDADEIVATGGHLINMTHAAEVNAFIAKSIAETRP